MAAPQSPKQDIINRFKDSPARDASDIYLPRISYPILIEEKLLCNEQDTINLAYIYAREEMLLFVIPALLNAARKENNKADIYQLDFARKRLIKKWKITDFIYQIFQIEFQRFHIFLSKPAHCFGLNEL